MTKDERRLARMALRYAILWNESFIDSMLNCGDKMSMEIKAQRTSENHKFDALLIKLQNKDL